MSAKPVNLTPVCTALDTGVAAERPPATAGWPGRVEAGVLKSLGVLLLLTAFASGLGAQHIAYMRAKNSLGRQLYQKDLEVRAGSQACRTLEAEKALLVAQGLQPVANSATMASTQGPTIGKTCLVAGGRGDRAAQGRASTSVLTNRRSQVAEARPPMHRGAIGG
jgi:hypothetical protein